MSGPDAAAVLLNVEHITLSFGAVVALDDVSFSVAPASVHAVIGPNGAGKSSLFNVISGLYRPASGAVRLGQHDLTTLRPHQIARAGVARAFQNIALSPELTVLDNLLIGRHGLLHYGMLEAIVRGPRFRREEAASRDRARHVAHTLGLDDCLDTRVVVLPYGLRKRVDVARALCMDPALVLLDEPAAGLTAEDRITVRDTIATLRDELSIAVVLVEHDVPLVMGVADRITVLDFGQVIAEGSPAEIRDNPLVIEAYLGIDHEPIEVTATP